MELLYFNTFREVAREKSITKAALKLGYAQSSITAQIQKLELAYGVQLIERHGKGIRLTPSGEELLGYTVRLLELYQESLEKISERQGGTLSIGTTDSVAAYCLPPYLRLLHTRYPELTIRLQPDQETGILLGVKEGIMDIGLLLDDNPQPDLLLDFIPLGEEPLLLVTPPDHPWARNPITDVEQVKDAVWVMPEESCNYRMMLERVLKKAGIPYKIGYELGSPEAVKRCVRNGLGIAVLPRMTVEDELCRGELAGVAFPHPSMMLQLLMVIHSKKWISKQLNAFMDLLQSPKKTK